MKKQAGTTTASRKTGKPATAKKATKKAAAKAPTKTTSKRAPKPVDAKSMTGVLNLPAIGSKLKRTYRGQEIVVEVTEAGFKYQGEIFASLSALAKRVTGYPAISGPAFFGLWKRAEAK